MKKVLIFIESLAGGGAEKALVNLVKKLDKSKYDITVITVTDGGVYQKDIASVCKYQSFLSVDNYRKGGLAKLLFWLNTKYIYNAPAEKVYRRFIKEQYDVEIAFVEGFATKLISSSNNNESKKIAWVHTDVLNNSYADRSYKSLNEQKDAYRKFDKVVCVSDTVKASFGTKYGCSNTEVIHNLLDFNEIIDLSKENIDHSVNKRIQLVTVGRLAEQKGYIRLLDVLSSIHKDGLDFSLWIIGDGPQRHDLEELITKFGLGEKVILLGFQSNPYKYVTKADAFVCSSYAEGFSTAATESLALGIPVFTVECSGMKELFDGHKYGQIVDNSDVCLQDMLRGIIQNPSQLEEYKIEAGLFLKRQDTKEKVLAIERLLDG